MTLKTKTKKLLESPKKNNNNDFSEHIQIVGSYFPRNINSLYLKL